MENINTIVFAKLKSLPSQISPLSLLSTPSVNGGLNRGFMVPLNVYNVSFILNLFRLLWENAGSYSCFFYIIALSIISVSLLGFLTLTELFHVCSMMRGDTVNKTSRLCLLHAANSVVG